MTSCARARSLSLSLSKLLGRSAIFGRFLRISKMSCVHGITAAPGELGVPRSVSLRRKAHLHDTDYVSSAPLLLRHVCRAPLSGLP